MARFFRGGSVIDKGAKRLQWELSADFDSENPARSSPPGRRSRGSDPGIPNLPSNHFARGSLSGPAQGLDRQLHPHRGSVCATSRNPLIAPPTQELTAALSGQFHPHRLQTGSTSLSGGAGYSDFQRRWRLCELAAVRNWSTAGSISVKSVRGTCTARSLTGDTEPAEGFVERPSGPLRGC